MYTKESLEKLRDKIDLVEVLSGHIELKKQGASYKALCPFHEEKTPSFVVQKGDSHYHCFGCQAHGDAIQFLMNYLRLSFGDAVEMLAEKFNSPLVRIDRKEERGVDKGALREALQVASHFYHCYLLQSEEGREALGYLEKRGISLSFINRFEIGLAPKQPGLLLKVMAARKIEEETLLACGLIGKEAKLDFFRERITFPIKNATGSVIGFSARKYRESTFGGKYINTPETPLFKKSRTLFGLHYSRERIAKERRAIIVEGQIDCLKLIEAGFNFTVASLGTAFGEEHVQDLHKLGCLTAIVMFDGDEAGEVATKKVGHLFQKVGIEVRVVRMPPGEDPDSFLKKYGPQKLEEEIARSCDYLTFHVDHLSKKFDMRIPAQKAELVQTIAEEVRSWEDPVMVHESLKSLSRLTHIPENIVGVGVVPAPAIYKKAPLAKGEIDPHRVLELDLLRWMILVGQEKKEIVDLILAYLTPSHFWIPVCRKLFESYMEAYAHGHSRDLLSLMIGVDQEEHVMDEIMNKKINVERAEKHVVETIQKLLDRAWLKEKEGIQQSIQEGKKSEAEVLLLVKRLDALNNNRKIVNEASYSL